MSNQDSIAFLNTVIWKWNSARVLDQGSDLGDQGSNLHPVMSFCENKTEDRGTMYAATSF